MSDAPIDAIGRFAHRLGRALEAVEIEARQLCDADPENPRLADLYEALRQIDLIADAGLRVGIL